MKRTSLPQLSKETRGSILTSGSCMIELHSHSVILTQSIILVRFYIWELQIYLSNELTACAFKLNIKRTKYVHSYAIINDINSRINEKT